jgi:hypothetical protein
MARQARTTYQSKVKVREGAIGMPPLEDLDREVLSNLLDPKGGIPFEFRAALRSRLGLPAEAAPPPELPQNTTTTTNTVSTNAPASKAAQP